MDKIPTKKNLEKEKYTQVVNYVSYAKKRMRTYLRYFFVVK